MSRKRVDVRLPPELIGRVHDARGSLTFTAFVERALESALSGSSQEPLVPKAPGAPSRAPVPRLDAVSPADGRGKISRPSVPLDVPGVVPASSLGRYAPKREVKPRPKGKS